MTGHVPTDIKKLQNINNNPSKSFAKQLVSYLLIQTLTPDYRKKIEEVKQLADEKITNILSLDNFCSDARNVIRTRDLTQDQKDLAEVIFCLSHSQRTQKIKYQTNRRDRNLSDVEIIDSWDIKNIVEKLGEEQGWLPAVILLLITTGRRLIEILRVTSIPTYAKGNDPPYIYIDKTAKAGKYPPSTNLKIPLLFIDFKKMQESWKKVRGMITEEDKELDNSQLTIKYNGLINDRIGRIFTMVKIKPTAHYLRKVYAAVTYDMHASPEMDRGLYISRLLGHHSITSSANYRNVIAEAKSDGIIQITVPDKFTELHKIILEIKKSGGKPTYKTIRGKIAVGTKLIKEYKDWAIPLNP